MNAELRKMRRETQSLELSLQRYTGEDLSCVRFEDLVELEHQLEESVNRVRARKVYYLIHQILLVYLVLMFFFTVLFLFACTV